jgi:hypothetical protein
MKIVNVNRHIVRSNEKNDEDKPPFRVSNGRYGKPYYVSDVWLSPFAHLVYRRKDPLPCGARVYIEIHDEGWKSLEPLNGHHD